MLPLYVYAVAVENGVTAEQGQRFGFGLCDQKAVERTFVMRLEGAKPKNMRETDEQQFNSVLLRLGGDEVGEGRERQLAELSLNLHLPNADQAEKKAVFGAL